MNESTIYRRHEQRRAKTYALRHDPRSAVARVASGLPLLNLIFPPYQPAKASNDEPPIKLHEIHGKTVNLNPSAPNDSSSKQSSNEVSRIIVASALGGGIAHYLSNSRSLTQSALSGEGMSSFHGITQLHDGQGALAFGRHIDVVKAITCEPVKRRGIVTMASGAAVISLLFGTRAMVANAVGANSSDPLSTTFIVSSATSGAVIGTIYAPLKAIQSHTIWMRQALHSGHHLSLQEAASSFLHTRGIAALVRSMPTVVGQHILGSTLYFSSYELLKTKISPTDEPVSFVAIGLSGAIAGAMYRGMTSGGKLTSILRAMPKSAVLFLGYETVLTFMVANDCKHS